MRSAVLRAALQELTAVGYRGLSLDGIARRAGVHRTTLYRRWGTREELLVEALLEHSAQRVPIPDTGSLREDLLALSRSIVANITTPEVEAVLRALVAEGGEDSIMSDASRQYWRARFDLARETVRRAMERGELPADTDPDFVIEALIGPLYLRLLITRLPIDNALAQRVVDLVLGGVLSPAGAGSERPPNAPSS